MDCSAYENRLAELLGADWSEPRRAERIAELRAHLRGCPHCAGSEDPEQPWKGVLCGSPLAGEKWIGRRLRMTGHAEEGSTLEGYLTIDPVRLPSGDLRLHGEGHLKIHEG